MPTDEGDVPFERTTFNELRAVNSWLIEHDRKTVNASMVLRLAEAGETLLAVWQSAADIVWGAETVDNMHAIALYSGIQDRIAEAVKQLETAARELQREEQTWMRYEP